VQVQAKIGREASDGSGGGRQRFFEHRGETLFHHYSDFEIGSGLFQELNGRCAEHAIAKRTEANNGDPAV
jgi:hypothetical protein